MLGGLWFQPKAFCFLGLILIYFLHTKATEKKNKIKMYQCLGPSLSLMQRNFWQEKHKAQASRGFPKCDNTDAETAPLSLSYCSPGSIQRPDLTWRKIVLLQMIPHLHETREQTVVFLIICAQPIASAAWHVHPWVRGQRVFLMACSSYACRQQRKVEISDRSMELFCHVAFSLSTSPAVTTWDPSIRQFVGLFRLFLI